MAIITISRGSHSMGRAVAEELASRLGYECLSRDVLLEASDRFNVPEVKLEHAIRDAPSMLERISGGREAYVAYIQSALTRHVCADNIVYHGLAGPVLLRNVSHLLKVRIIADMDLRVSVVMERDGLGSKAAAQLIAKLDRQRAKWMKSLYGVDPADPGLYDLFVKLPPFDVDDAARLIARAAKSKRFATTAASQQAVEDLALACEIKAALVNQHHDVSVASTYGNVVVYSTGGGQPPRKLKRAVQAIADETKGVNNIEVHAGVSPPSGAV